MSFPRQNNLEILRLAFASQVMLVHAVYHITGNKIRILDHFPGVPAFFFVSGFLIYASCTNSTSLRDYLLNRFLRLYPGLIFVSIAGLALVAYVKNFSFLTENSILVLTWLASQITLGQAYNPPEFRDVGVGVINGSLWTITVEVLFYLLVPILVWIEKKISWLLLATAITSLSIYIISINSTNQYFFHGRDIFQYISLTPFPWGWMFALGALTYKYFPIIQSYLNRAWLAAPALIILITVNDKGILLNAIGNHLGVLYFILYIAIILYIAFSIKPIQLNFDISFGVYIWHMIFVNLSLEIGLSGIQGVAFSMVSTICMSLISWHLIERPALAMKRYTLKKIN